MACFEWMISRFDFQASVLRRSCFYLIGLLHVGHKVISKEAKEEINQSMFLLTCTF